MDGRPCVGKPLADTAVVEGVSYYRVPFQPPRSFNATDFGADPTGATDSTAAIQAALNEAVSYPLIPSCHDCTTPVGGLHHPGCDAERCPRCLGQAISCGCLWEGESMDPEGDSERWPNDEAPEARRSQ